MIQFEWYTRREGKVDFQPQRRNLANLCVYVCRHRWINNERLEVVVRVCGYQHIYPVQCLVLLSLAERVGRANASAHPDCESRSRPKRDGDRRNPPRVYNTNSLDFLVLNSILLLTWPFIYTSPSNIYFVIFFDLTACFRIDYR